MIQKIDEVTNSIDSIQIKEKNNKVYIPDEIIDLMYGFIYNDWKTRDNLSLVCKQFNKIVKLDCTDEAKNKLIEIVRSTVQKKRDGYITQESIFNKRKGLDSQSTNTTEAYLGFKFIVNNQSKIVDVKRDIIRNYNKDFYCTYDLKESYAGTSRLGSYDIRNECKHHNLVLATNVPKTTKVYQTIFYFYSKSKYLIENDRLIQNKFD